MDSVQDSKDDQSGISRALSAYQIYSKMNAVSIKEELISSGKDSAMGAISTATSLKWKSLTEDEKQPYEDMAKKDRLRFEAECAKRDEEVLRQQEERRNQNALTETSSRARATTLKQSEDLDVRIMETHKAPRVLSKEEIERSEARKKSKQAHENAISSQHDHLAKMRADAAENRLKYLLQQSDIFGHFGVTAGKTSKSATTPMSPVRGTTQSAPQGTPSRHRGNAQSNDELDADERAMVEDAENEGNGAEAHHTVLTKQPSIITGGVLRPYQMEGLNWMIRLEDNGINGILADEMGLGKTLQSISILAYLREFKKVVGPHLVIVPKSTLSNWGNEFNRFCPSIRVLRFHGDKDERQEIAQNVLKPELQPHQRSWDVCITTYEVANLEKTSLCKIAWRYLIIDEAHRIKNEASQFSRNIRLLNTQHRLLLTGTPLQNNLHELWALLNYLLPDVFASSEQFDEWFNLDVDDTEAKQRIISQLHKILRPFMLRRLKADVEKSLPPKVETILFTGMSAAQKQLYRQVLLRDIDILQTGGGNSEGSRTTILNIVMQLRKCCNHPYLFPGIEDRTMDPLGEHLVQNCGKMVLLDKLLSRLAARKNRGLIFSQMTRMLDILEDYCIMRGYSYCRIDGNTSYEEREDRIQAYNAPDSKIFLFLLSTRAGGLGINLQTADTVILYDSDWNPQADLQAQDRAHRIGQKKIVNVFRLVTDDTVEVKVIERAQQKLKLDAMVVQQGRLVDKEKKISKDELLQTLRFGADKIFRSKDSTISDDDIDMIMEAGKRRTEEMSDKLKEVEKGDLYNFSLDGGGSNQVFEGKDYSDRAMREQYGAEAGLPFFLDVGKRERKTVLENATAGPTNVVAGAQETAPKIPRHLRLPKMDDWQFYNRKRLSDLQDQEQRIFDEMVAKKDPQLSDKSFLSKLILLPAELHEEKQNLLNSAFSNWTKVHFSNFVRSCAKYGRNECERIAKDVGVSADDVARYRDCFFSLWNSDGSPGSAANLKSISGFAFPEWERNIKTIEKGERRLEEIQRLTGATGQLIAMFQNPWEELTLKNVGNVNKLFTSAEDRYILCLTQLHGYGSWDLVRNSIRRCERFRFDYYIQSCSTESIAKRCELLMRAAERELTEIEKKRTLNRETVGGVSVSSCNESREKLQELVKQIAEESKQLVAARSLLSKVLLDSDKELPPGVVPAKEPSQPAPKSVKSPVKVKAESSASATAPISTEAGTLNKASASRITAKTVPENLLPELSRLIIAAGPGGIQKIITAFQEKYPDISKRQIEINIDLIAEKDKRGSDTMKVWYMRPEYEKYLKMDGDSIPVDASDAKESTPKKRKSEETDTPAPKKVKSSTPKAKTPASTASTPDATGTLPKKPKRAFGFFIKSMRSAAEAEVKSSMSPEGDLTELLKAKLLEMWNTLDGDGRAMYEAKESEDKQRYDKEVEEFIAKGGDKSLLSK